MIFGDKSFLIRIFKELIPKPKARVKNLYSIFPKKKELFPKNKLSQLNQISNTFETIFGFSEFKSSAILSKRERSKTKVSLIKYNRKSRIKRTVSS